MTSVAGEGDLEAERLRKLSPLAKLAVVGTSRHLMKVLPRESIRK